jgi:TRAP transporter TAXI family solute receptor
VKTRPSLLREILPPRARRLIAAAALAVCCLGVAGNARAEERLLTIGAAPLGGTYYPAALALAEIINKYVPQTQARVEVTGGTMENPALMQEGELQLGLANADVAFFAFRGEAPFPAPLSDIRAMFVGLAPGVVQYAVLKNSGIASVRDLAGKRVAVGPQGNSSGLLFLKVLKFYGVDPGKVTRSFVSFADGINELLDGHVDMAVVQAGLPAPGLQEAFAGGRKIRILSFPEEERDAFLKQYPYYIPVTIPRGTYPAMADEATTFATQNLVLVHAALSPDIVHAVTRAVFEHLPELYAAHPSLRSVTLEAAARAAIPLHEGALRYFREMAVLPDK